MHGHENNHEDFNSFKLLSAFDIFHLVLLSAFFSLEELEAASRESPEKIAILQISELTLACSISQMSTPQHVFLRNSPYILDTLTLQNTFRRLLLSDS